MPSPSFVLKNCRVFDGTSDHLRDGLEILVEGKHI